MYLPDSIERAKVLITVKTYPLPSNKYEELVCTASVLEDGRWIRFYLIPILSNLKHTLAIRNEVHYL